MTRRPAPILQDLDRLPTLPAWASSGSAESSEAVAFRSGAALLALDTLVSDPICGVPVKLLANHLALTAATATSKLEGRLATVADIRDAYHLTPPGAARGPDGDLLAFWRDATGKRRIDGDALRQLAGTRLEPEVDGWMRAGIDRANSHGPLAGCVRVLRAVLEADDRAERIACLLSDVVLARALRWKIVLPTTAQRLTKTLLRELVTAGPEAERAIQRRLLDSVQDTVQLARDLSQRAAALRTIAPKLRAKGSQAAVALFLSEDAVAPSGMLSPRVQGTTTPMTDRAARRFCDRLVDLGVAREVTGRASFRLYGI